MKNRALKQEFQGLDRIEKDIYSTISRRQQDMLRELSEKQQKIDREVIRKQQIRLKSNPEIVKHPYNGHVWVSLANFINHDQDIDLKGIAERHAERKQFRLDLEAKQKRQQNEEDNEQHTQQRQIKKGGGKIGISKNVDWRLTRQLRRKEVEENRKRLERMEENKREKMSYYHRY